MTNQGERQWAAGGVIPAGTRWQVDLRGDHFLPAQGRERSQAIARQAAERWYANGR